MRQPFGEEFYRRITVTQPLDAEAEAELGRLAASGDVTARHALAGVWLRFAVTVARRYRWSRLDEDELIGEAILGLTQAANGWTPGQGRFSSFAFEAINNRIKSALTRSRPKGYRLSADRDQAPGTLSVDASMKEDGDDYGSLLADPKVVQPADDADAIEAARHLRSVLPNIEARRLKILTRRYVDGLTLEEIAAADGRSRQAVQQHEVRARDDLVAELLHRRRRDAKPNAAPIRFLSLRLTVTAADEFRRSRLGPVELVREANESRRLTFDLAAVRAKILFALRSRRSGACNSGHDGIVLAIRLDADDPLEQIFSDPSAPSPGHLVSARRLCKVVATIRPHRSVLLRRWFFDGSSSGDASTTHVLHLIEPRCSDIAIEWRRHFSTSRDSSSAQLSREPVRPKKEFAA